MPIVWESIVDVGQRRRYIYIYIYTYVYIYKCELINNPCYEHQVQLTNCCSCN